MYRVKEVDGIFIPQKYEFLIGWEGVSKTGSYLWDSDFHQKNHCSFKTLEEARERIKTFKVQVKIPKFKIHKEK